MLLIHWRDVVESIEIRERLEIGLVFDQLLGAAMEQADMSGRGHYRYQPCRIE